MQEKMKIKMTKEEFFLQAISNNFIAENNFVMDYLLDYLKQYGYYEKVHFNARILKTFTINGKLYKPK